MVGKYLHELSDHIPADHMVKNSLKERIPHDLQLDPVPVPDQDGAVLQSCDSHLEIFISGHSKPLRRVKKLVLSHKVKNSPSLRDDEPDMGNMRSRRKYQ